MRILSKKAILKMITEYINKFLNYFPTITKEESDYIYEILQWDHEKKIAFNIAKKIFEDEEQEEKMKNGNDITK
jgi:hypothetical protein